jgi:hypothetical protein
VKFLLVKPGHFGDALLLTPTIRLLRECYPNALIDVAVRRGAHAVLEGIRICRVCFYCPRRPGSVWALVPKSGILRGSSLMSPRGGTIMRLISPIRIARGFGCCWRRRESEVPTTAMAN